MTTKVTPNNPKITLLSAASPLRDKRISSMNNNTVKKNKSSPCSDKKENFKGSKILENLKKHKLESIINSECAVSFANINESDKTLKLNATIDKKECKYYFIL
jgi:hypothetical protein